MLRYSYTLFFEKQLKEKGTYISKDKMSGTTKSRAEYMKQYRAKKKAETNFADTDFSELIEDLEKLKKENEELNKKVKEYEEWEKEIDGYADEIERLIPILEAKFQQQQQPIQQPQAYVSVITPDVEEEPDEPRKEYIHDFTAKKPPLPRLHRKTKEESDEEKETSEFEIDENGNVI